MRSNLDAFMSSPTCLEAPERAEEPGVDIAFGQRAAANARVVLPFAAQADVSRQRELGASAEQRPVIGFLIAGVGFRLAAKDAELAVDRDRTGERPHGEAYG